MADCRQQDSAYVYAVTVGRVVRYIGKGRGDRVDRHLPKARRYVERMQAGETIKTSLFYSLLCKSISSGKTVQAFVLKRGLTDEAAWRLERTLIAAYGRLGLDKTGTLWNYTSGGDGFTPAESKALLADPAVRAKLAAAKKGKRLSEAHKAKIAASVLRAFADPKVRARIGDGQRGRTATAAHRAAISAALKGRERSPEHCKNISAAKVGLIRTAESRERQRIAMKAVCATEEGAAHIRRAVAASHAGFNEERRAKLKAAQALRWSDPAERERSRAIAKDVWRKRKLAAAEKGQCQQGLQSPASE